jgi:hypothetical protein
VVTTSREHGILPPISRHEWRWLALLAFVLIALAQGPPTVERTWGPADRVHVGTYWYHTDFSAYLAAMHEGARTSSWLIRNPVSAEEHQPALMFPMYVAIGKLASAVGLPVLMLYAVVENATRILLSAALYVFVAVFVGGVADRRRAYCLAVFASGLSLFLVPLLGDLGVPTARGHPSVQVVTFGLFLAAPHLGLGLAASLMAMVLAPPASRGSRWALAWLAADVVILSLVHPFNLPTVVVTVGVYALVRSWRARRIDGWSVAACVVSGMAGAPLLIYNFLTFTFDPFWSKTHGEANVIPSPRPWELPLDYGLILLLALLALVQLWQGRVSGDDLADAQNGPGRARDLSLLLAWLGTGFVFMYLPVAYQHRFAFGLQPAMCVLAALGWPNAHAAIRGSASRLAPRTAPLIATLVLAVPTFSLPTVVYGGLLVSAVSNQPIRLYTVDRDTYDLGEWITANSGPEDVLLGSVNTGEVLSGMVPGRVVVGRKAGTIAYPEKEAAMRAMYRGELAERAIRNLLRENRVSFLIVGPEERLIGTSDPGAQLGLSVAKRVGTAITYRVTPADRGEG